MWRDLIRKDRLRSILLLALYLALTLLAQNTLFARLRIWGVHVCILPALMMAVCMFRGPIPAGVFGIFAGVFAEMAYPESTVLFLLLLPLLGYFGGILADLFHKPGIGNFDGFGLGDLLLLGCGQIGRNEENGADDGRNGEQTA